MGETYIIKEETLTNIADAIRAKIGSSEQMTPSEMAKNINRITGEGGGVDVSGVTATAEDVLSPKVFVDSEGNEIIGTIPVVELGQPSLDIDSWGMITSNVIQEQGFVFSSNKSTTKQLETQAAKNITPSFESQIVVTSGLYTIGDIIVNAIPNNYVQLNFEVVGGATQPSNPKENTIWVNTEVAITAWEFSAIAPTAPVEGMVWFATSEISNVVFNALKKNNIAVYPISANQYVNGTWTVKTAQSYIGGVWKSWTRYLYNLGDQCTDLTGGWMTQAVGRGTTSSPDYNQQAEKPVLTTQSNGGVKLHMDYGTGIYRTVNKIDLTGVSTITFNGTLKARVANNWTGIYVWSEIGKYYVNNVAASLSLSANTIRTGDTTLDVSGLTGSYYVGLGLHENTVNSDSGYIIMNSITIG